ncbi:hypothetical protein PQX77_008504 [Marasmius sp. AFHP31]|nr:hypothetical protein PQX77_008504 [Marasmius sp. AFHP31]
MLLAQGTQLVDLTVTSYETKSLSFSQRSDASLSRWPLPRRLSSWETTRLATVAQPPLPSTLDEEFARVKTGAEAPSISTAPQLDIKIHRSREDFIPSSYVYELHPDLQKLCEGDESDDDSGYDPELISDMPVVQLSSLQQDVASLEDSTYSEWDEENGNDVLQFLYSLKQCILIESMDPKNAPHIVITPCEDTWDDQNVAWLNRVDVQSPSHLHVPPTDVSEYVVHPDHDHRILYDTSKAARPSSVFNRNKFEDSINRSSVERLIMFEVILVVRRQLFKTVVLEASQVALSLRRHYDTHDAFEKLEKRFYWTDPAEPLLSYYRRCHGTVFVDSPAPFLVPHIVISAPPPENPWYKWSNQINSPQDCGFGQLLVVPACGIEFINELEDACGDWTSEAYEDVECYGNSFTSTIDSYRMFMVGDPEDDEDQSPGPETPTDEQEEDDFKTSFDRALRFKFERSMDAGPSTYPPPSSCPDDVALARYRTGVSLGEFDSVENGDVDALYDSNTVEAIPRPSCQPQAFSSACANWSSLEDDDDSDEEGLPPLDEWYQSVLRRTDSLPSPIES